MGVQVSLKGHFGVLTRRLGPSFVPLQLARVLRKYSWLNTMKLTGRLHDRLWTDEMNLKLVENLYPWFLKVFTSLDHIMKADAARYMYMHHYGGAHPLTPPFRCFSHVSFNTVQSAWENCHGVQHASTLHKNGGQEHLRGLCRCLCGPRLPELEATG